MDFVKDEQLRILVLTKLYELNRKQESVSNIKNDEIFNDVEPSQLNFCFQYLGTLHLIDNSYSHERGIYRYDPQIITGKGIDIVESLMSSLGKKIKDTVFQNATSSIDKVVIFLADFSTKQDIWDMLIQFFNTLIEKLMVIF